MDLTFHVIFCPDSVRCLRLAVLSFLRFSDYRYRLVANGLGRAELQELHELARSSSRLECLVLPTRTVLPHGIALSLLQARETGSHFCFVDSDVFASAPFGRALEEHLADCDVFSSCNFLSLPWATEESRRGYGGTCLETPNGLSLATTIFAVYRQEPLRRVISATGVGFEDYLWREQHQDRVVDRLADLGIDAGQVRYFDTGKLLNILSHGHGLRFRYADLPGLTHVGGLSIVFNPGVRYTLRLDSARMARLGCSPGGLVTLGYNIGWFETWMSLLLRRPHVLRDSDFEHGGLGSRIRAVLGRANTAADDRLRRERAQRRRYVIAKYFGLFLRSLVDGSPEPRLAIGDADLESQILGLCEVLRQIHGQEAERFPAGSVPEASLAAS
jgi:hypothetical protein